MNDHERRLNQHDEDIRYIYDELREHSRLLRSHDRELRWLRRAVTKILYRLDIDPPADEEG